MRVTRNEWFRNFDVQSFIHCIIVLGGMFIILKLLACLALRKLLFNVMVLRELSTWNLLITSLDLNSRPVFSTVYITVNNEFFAL